VSAGFTPGPWTAFPRLARGVHHGYFIDAAVGNDADNGYVIADLIVGRHQEANARLIAAAPELYEALDSLLRTRGVFTHGSDNYMSPLEEQGINALAKARGDA
jgi:hypothetical protein